MSFFYDIYIFLFVDYVAASETYFSHCLGMFEAKDKQYF